MRIGIVLQYRRNDATYAALRLGDFFRSLGYEVSLFSLGVSRIVPRLHAEWDRRVVAEIDADYCHWASGCHTVVFAVSVDSELVQIANDLQRRTIVLAPWDALPTSDGNGLRQAYAVVCPFQSSTDLVRREYRLDNVVHVPWDCGLPTTRRAADDAPPGRVRILFAAHCGLSDRTWPELVAQTARRVAEACPTVDASVSITPKSMQAASLTSLRRLTSPPSGNGTLSIVEDSTGWSHGPLIYGRHDLTVWPSEIDGFGMVGLESLCMGTPVVAYDAQPMNELVRHMDNGALIDCRMNTSALGVPMVEPDWDALESAVIEIAARRSLLTALRRHTRSQMAKRRLHFRRQWEQLVAI